jgi:predicted  nucleic acid-binding Zn-ribbon protein
VADLNDLKRQIEDLRKQYSDLTKKPAALFNTDNLKDANASITTLNKAIADAKREAASLEEGFGGIDNTIKSIVSELKKGNEASSLATKAFRGIQNITEKLKYDQQDISKLSLEQLKRQKDKLKEYQQEIRDQSKIISEKVQSLVLDKNGNQLAGAALQSRLDRLKLNGQINKSEVAIYMAAKENFAIFEETNNLLNERIKKEEQINAKLGLTGKLIKGISQVPLVGQFVDADKALGKMRDTAQAGGSKIAVLGAGFKSIGGDIAKGIMDPLFLVTQLVKLFVDVDKQAGEFAKSQNMSYKDALKTREEYAAMAVSSGDMSLNAKVFMETQSAIGAQLGTNAKINKADLETFTKLREKAGFTNEELMGVQQLSLVNGKSLKKNTSEILGGAKAYASRNKLVVNEKQILKDISKASASLKLSLGGSANELARSAVQARKFGLNLEQAEKMSQSLLDFESSIENELSAELLTGKDLNLERARGLALNGDSAAAAAEIASQVGSAANFGKMNVIQQEAIAKSVGMQRDELAQSLIDKESLAKLSAKEGQTALEAYQAMKDRGMTEAQIATELGDKELQKQLEQQSNAEKFAQTMEHVKEIFVSIVDGPMGDILNGLASMLKNTKVIYAITGLLAGMYAGKLIQGIMQAIAQVGVMIAANTANAAAATTAATAMSLGAMIPVILGGVGAIMGLVASFTADDMMSAPSGYGKRTLLGPEGAIQLNDKDTVIAGTNLFGNDVKSEPGKSTQMSGKGEIKVGGDSSSVVNAIMELRKDVNALANRPINVAIDGKKVIEATTGAQPNTQGDENRKNSYKIS